MNGMGKGTLRLVAALAIGSLAAVVIAAICFSLMRAAWPAYVTAEPTKAYTLSMMLARLSIGVLCAAGAACVATIVAGDDGRAAWWLGAFFVVISLPDHLYYVWDDYPVWYHFVYLGYLVPVAVFSARAFLSWTGHRGLRRAVA